MEIIDVVQVQKVGSSLYLLLSIKLREKLDVKEGDEFILTLNDGNIVFMPKIKEAKKS